MTEHIVVKVPIAINTQVALNAEILVYKCTKTTYNIFSAVYDSRRL